MAVDEPEEARNAEGEDQEGGQGAGGPWAGKMEVLSRWSAPSFTKATTDAVIRERVLR